VGQYLAEVTEELVRRGFDVVVLTSDRGYDDPTIKLERHEVRKGVQIHRLPLTSFGKGSIKSRLAGGISLSLQAVLTGLLDGGFQSLFLSTAPPVEGLVGVLLHALRGIPFDYWLMDLNPDQAVQMGKAQPHSLSVRLLDGLNRQILRRARNVFALDDAMAERFARKYAREKPVEVLPLWPLKESRTPESAGIEQFLEEHALTGTRVIMHSGNHSLVHPLETLVEAVKRLDESTSLRFLFVGGGVAKRPIEAWVKEQNPPHVQCLPYQPIERLGDVLGAATVHVVVVGPTTVGIVHPSKLYGALAAGKPILVLGPQTSPAARLVLARGIGWHVEHGDVPRMQQVLGEIAAASTGTLADMGTRALELANGEFSRATLLERLIQAVVAPS
jgi:hypothetical protein